MDTSAGLFGESAPILSVRQAWKRYPGVVALRGVDFDVRRGEVHVVLGGNGAGKSTLAKVIGGVEEADDGEIYFEGQSVRGLGPSRIAEMGVAVIHQRLHLFPSLSVAENLAWLVRHYPTRRGMTLRADAQQQAQEILAVLGDRKISPTSRISDLREAEAWLVTIAAALWRNPKLLILDESTAALPEADARMLFQFLRERRDSGLAVVLVTHRLDEIREIADRVTVMSDGVRVGQADGQCSTHELVAMMFGDELAAQLEHARRSTGRPAGSVLVEFREVTTRRLRKLSLRIHRGEVLGVAGALGSGRTELVRALIGDTAIHDGSIQIDDREHRPRNPQQAIGKGVALVAEGRDRNGVLHGLTLERNITLSGLSRVRRWMTPLVSRRRERALADEAIGTLSIKGTRKQDIATLSGGNQQKALIGRALLLKDDLLILDEPSAGVDVATRLDLHNVLHRLADEGHAVLIISSEFDDLVRDCTRIVVLRGGTIVDEDAPFDAAALARIAYTGSPTTT